MMDTRFSFSDESKSCIFCERSADSKEHIFPRWLKSWFADGGWSHTTFSEGQKSADGILHQPGALLVTMRVVCQSCNNGWMARIQDQCKPILESYLRGRTSTPSIMERQVLDLWAAMTSMVSELSDWPTMTTSKYVREILRERKTKPSNYKIAFYLSPVYRFGFNSIAWAVDEKMIAVSGTGFPYTPPTDERVSQISFGNLGAYVCCSEMQCVNSSNFYIQQSRNLESLNFHAAWRKFLFSFDTQKSLDSFTRSLVHPSWRDYIKPLGSTSRSRHSGKRRKVRLKEYDGKE